MKTKQIIGSTALAIILHSLSFQSTFASTDTVTHVEPAYSDYHVAQHAANSAQHTAEQPNTAIDSMLEDIESSNGHMQQVKANGTRTQLHNAERQLRMAEETYMSQLSAMTGVTVSDIEKMHESGMSLNDIGSELGVHTGMNIRSSGSATQGHIGGAGGLMGAGMGGNSPDTNGGMDSGGMGGNSGSSGGGNSGSGGSSGGGGHGGGGGMM